jgi:hypothetical protein
MGEEGFFVWYASGPHNHVRPFMVAFDSATGPLRETDV